ncbi:DUF975 family protein [Streptococcus moroccensis]|uniref:Membrane protein n=1 Tax=Streptococcus moroccensis TaxID=1451356 RepID=A0ABT9YRN9_9STRE|nr:DUF975 family protein [Streptococcus moroccensis]MDQ0222659.1 putative membrane protein [Streptococcus moroccensis]
MENYDIREEARQVLANLKGKYLLFLIPIVMQIFSTMNTIRVQWNTLGEEGMSNPALTNTTALSANAPNLVWEFSGDIFNSAISILMSFITLGILWTMLETIRGLRSEVTFKDSLRAFSSDHFGKVFATLFMKGLFLFLWSLPLLIGAVTVIVSAGFLLLDYLQEITLTIDPNTVGLIFLAGALVSVLGLIPLIIKSYSYAMTEYILHDEIKNGTYTSARSCITASRHMMNGYKFQLFLLQFSFIGWWLLVAVTFGLAAIYVIPYYNTTQTVFYNRLTKYLQTH